MAQINDDEFFAGVELPFQFVHGDARDAQITKKALAGDKFVGKGRSEGSKEKDQEPAAKRGEMLRHELDLTTKDVTKAEEGAGPEKRSRGIEQKETPQPHVKDAGKRRRDSAQAGEKLCQQKRTGALLRKNAFGAANAGIRLQRNLAEKLKDADAFATAKLVPDRIRCHGGQHDIEHRSEETQAASTCEGSSSEQQRHRRKRQPHLLGENPSEQYYISMMEEEFESAVHGWAGSVISGYFVAKGAVCPQWPAMTNSFMGLRVLGAISRSCKG